MTMRPCLTCGLPSAESYCTEHVPAPKPSPYQSRRGSARRRGYSASWDKLSRRARKLQPFCSDCGTTENLTTDHLPSAWQRVAERKPLRLADVDVVCAEHNAARGSSRPGSERARACGQPWGQAPPEGLRTTRAKAQEPSYTQGVYCDLVNPGGEDA